MSGLKKEETAYRARALLYCGECETTDESAGLFHYVTEEEADYAIRDAGWYFLADEGCPTCGLKEREWMEDLSGRPENPSGEPTRKGSE